MLTFDYCGIIFGEWEVFIGKVVLFFGSGIGVGQSRIQGG